MSPSFIGPLLWTRGCPAFATGKVTVRDGAEENRRPTRRPPRLPRRLHEGQGPFNLPLHHWPLAAPCRARPAVHLVLDVFIQLRYGHDPVTVAVGFPAQAFEQVVGKGPMAQGRQFQGHLVGPAGRDDDPPAALSADGHVAADGGGGGDVGGLVNVGSLGLIGRTSAPSLSSRGHVGSTRAEKWPRAWPVR